MPAYEVLRKNHEFKRVYAKGNQQASAELVCYCMKNRRGAPRIGITTSKKIGNAVTRNRARRVIRAAVYALLPEIKGGWDVVFVARTKTACQKSTRIQITMDRQLRRAGIIK